MRYNISKIKKMRLEGMSLENIADFYNVHKTTISKYLKNKGVVFGLLPRKCNYCNKIFIPKSVNQLYCSKIHQKYNDQERRWTNQFKVQKRHKYNIFLKRNSHTYYLDAINHLNDLKALAEVKKCSECRNDEFIIENGSVFCTKCGLEFI